MNPGQSAGTQPQSACWRGRGWGLWWRALQSFYLSRRPAERCLGSASVAPSTSSPPASASAAGAAQVSRRAPQLLPLLVVVLLRLLLLPLLLRLWTTGTWINVPHALLSSLFTREAEPTAQGPSPPSWTSKADTRWIVRGLHKHSATYESAPGHIVQWSASTGVIWYTEIIINVH